ncbi:MAG: hypothetical protein IAG13_32715 [Deltaproteobacteria bacterium]|nr:hypothetical protein [Nannocystaceae bacterium]
MPLPTGEADRSSSGTDDAPRVQPVDERTPRVRPRREWLRISGYVQPQFTYRVRDDARPRDRRELGAGSTRAGLVFSGAPLRRWSYTIHVVLGATLINTITRVDVVDDDGDGTVDGVATRAEPVPGLFVEELSVRYRPVDAKRSDRDASLVHLDLKLGQLRIPWTVQQKVFNAALMFPRRSAPNDVFLFGTDLGALASLGVLEDRVELSAGVFNGTGLAVQRSNERGALYSGRLDINPLGGFAYNEGDLERERFRFGVGTGALYFPSRLYDDAGNDTGTRARDLRVSASLRMSVRGFYVQAEYLRRQRTDALSSLPRISQGAYVQSSMFVALPRELGIAPIGRFGWTTTDQRVSPRTVLYGEAGVALYLGNEERRDALRVLVQYLGEARRSEHERADGASMQLQLRF